MKPLYFIAIILYIISASCESSNQEKQASANNNDQPDTADNDSAVNLPDGFKIEVFAEVENARSLAVSPSGVVYVGNRAEDKVYALKDTDGDWKADEKYVIASGLRMPNGVAFKDGDLYVAEVSKIWRYPNIEANLDNPPEPILVTDDYPTERHHGWKYIAFGPDGKLYVPVGAPCNICESDEIYASITRINTNGTGREIVARGVRNTVGFDWHRETGELWFTDNGRDMMGDNIPPCELNKVSKVGQHFGYPYCHGGDIGDPQFGSKRHCNDFVRPQYNFKAHTAPLGMTFYTGDMFPAEYKGDIFVAQHGSWNRSSKIGYRIMHIDVKDNRAMGATVFADGWLNDRTQDQTGRPVDVLQMADGSLLISDDYGNKVYRISYAN